MSTDDLTAGEWRGLRLVAQSKLYAREDWTPKQEFSIGDRVQSHTFRGTVYECVPQLHTDNLYRIHWDGDPLDTDFYAAHGLSRIEAEAA